MFDGLVVNTPCLRADRWISTPDNCNTEIGVGEPPSGRLQGSAGVRSWPSSRQVGVLEQVLVSDNPLTAGAPLGGGAMILVSQRTLLALT